MEFEKFEKMIRIGEQLNYCKRLLERMGTEPYENVLHSLASYRPGHYTEEIHGRLLSLLKGAIRDFCESQTENLKREFGEL